MILGDIYLDRLKEVYRSLCILREDAVTLGMDDLAITYGWSAIRFGAEINKELTYRAGLSRSP